MNKVKLLIGQILGSMCLLSAPAFSADGMSQPNRAAIKEYEHFFTCNQCGHGLNAGLDGVSYAPMNQFVVEQYFAPNLGLTRAHSIEHPAETRYLWKSEALGKYWPDTVVAHDFVFCDGLAAVDLGWDGRCYRCAVIDPSGRFVIKPMYASIGGFKNGLAPCELYQPVAPSEYRQDVPTKVGYIDSHGHVLFAIDRDRYRAVHQYSEGLAVVEFGGKTTAGYKATFGYVDLKGNLQIPAKFETASPFSEGLAAVSLNKRYGFIDKTGSMAIPATFKHAGNFADGLAPVRIAGKWGYINHNGRTVIEPQFASAADFSEGLAVVQPFPAPSRFGYINREGKFIVPAKFVAARPFHGGIAYIEDPPETDPLANLIIRMAGFIVPAHPLRGIARYIDGNGNYLPDVYKLL